MSKEAVIGSHKIEKRSSNKPFQLLHLSQYVRLMIHGYRRNYNCIRTTRIHETIGMFEKFLSLK
mgnify:CR=1 FL=1